MRLFKPNVAKMSAKGDIEGLVRAFNDREEPIRIEAIKALGKIKSMTAEEALIRLLMDSRENAVVRSAAAQAIGEIGDYRAVEPLIHIFTNKDENADLRAAAACALGEIGDTRAVKPLVQALKDKNWSIRWAVVSPLVKMGTNAVEPLISVLRDRDTGVREKAAWALGGIGDAKAIESITPLLRDQNEGVRERAAWALERLGYVEGASKLISRERKRGKHVSVTLLCQECGLPLIHAYENRFCCDNPDCPLFGHIVT